MVPTAPARSRVRRSSKPLKGTDAGTVIVSFLLWFHEPDVAVADRAAMRLEKLGASLDSGTPAIAFLRQRKFIMDDDAIVANCHNGVPDHLAFWIEAGGGEIHV